ncbi:MAG TPA: DoxX family protein [Pyrinomonadaceae bacterium]|nr:DoxX family protein [Pyrinomonadaceae bacterium]
MANSDSSSSTWGPRVLSVLRIVAAFMLLQHGMQKIFGVLLPPADPGAPQSHGTFEWLSLAGIAGILEFVGPLFLLLGLFTRPVAFILSGLMAFAYFIGHFKQGWYGFWPILNRGELAALYSFVFLYLAAAGGGAWSLDRLLRRDRPSYR